MRRRRSNPRAQGRRLKSLLLRLKLLWTSLLAAKKRLGLRRSAQCIK